MPLADFQGITLLPNCHNCETKLDLRWRFCPNCGITTARNKSEPSDSKNLSAWTIGRYGRGVREQVFEVIVQQAMRGAPWREICSGPMLVNQISEAEIEIELRRRQGEDNGEQPTRIPKRPNPPDDEFTSQLIVPLEDEI